MWYISTTQTVVHGHWHYNRWRIIHTQQSITSSIPSLLRRALGLLFQNSLSHSNMNSSAFHHLLITFKYNSISTVFFWTNLSVVEQQMVSNFIPLARTETSKLFSAFQVLLFSQVLTSNPQHLL